MPENEQLLTAAQAADYLHIHRNTLTRWVRNGDLVAVRLGSRGDMRFRPADLESFIANALTPERPDPEAVQAQRLVAVDATVDATEDALDEAMAIIPSAEAAVLFALSNANTPASKAMYSKLLKAIRAWCNANVDGYQPDTPPGQREAAPFA